MAKLPKFKNIQQAAEWAETHDTAPYFDEMEDAPGFHATRPLRLRARVNVYLTRDALARLRQLAKRKRLDYHTLAETFILERLAQDT